MTDFLELAKKRYSTRRYKTQKVEEENLRLILEAGRVAPTATNAQPQRIIVVREKEGLQKVNRAANIFGAPLAIIVCADHTESWKRPYDGKGVADIYAAIVTDHMMLEATELGLGSVWICHFKPDMIKEEFDLPDFVEPINILAIGYEAGIEKSPDRHSSMRKSLEETVSSEVFKE